MSGSGTFKARLPATSANLGPGFDAVGLALALFLDIEASPAPAFRIAATGRDPELTGSLSNNLILMTYTEILGAMGVEAPPLAITLHNQIPLGMGCGSSAAALCAGVLLANHFGGLRLTPEQVLDEAARREGHPDNVAACLLGGLTVARTLPGRAFTSTPSHTLTATFGTDLSWRLLLALPAAGLATSKARALLPNTYSRADVVLNIQATALLVSAFALDRPTLLAAATDDRIHQPFRLPVCPLLDCLLPLSGTPGVWSVTLSGAGPSVLIIASQTLDPGVLRDAAGSELHELIELSVAAGAFGKEL